jgi:hypothetical protein
VASFQPCAAVCVTCAGKALALVVDEQVLDTALTDAPEAFVAAAQVRENGGASVAPYVMPTFLCSRAAHWVLQFPLCVFFVELCCDLCVCMCLLVARRWLRR